MENKGVNFHVKELEKKQSVSKERVWIELRKINAEINKWDLINRLKNLFLEKINKKASLWQGWKKKVHEQVVWEMKRRTETGRSLNYGGI